MSNKFLAKVLAKSGRSLDDAFQSNTNVGKLIRRTGVRHDAEFDRIKRLPRRVWETDPELPELVQAMTAWLKTPNGTMELRPVQATVLKELRDYDGCMGVARVGCHRAGTQVMLANGRSKAVEDVEVGDQLMGPDSKPRNVLELRSGMDEMVEIRPAKGASWEVNLDHVLTIVISRGGPEELIDVTVRDWLEWPKRDRRDSKLVRRGVDLPASENLPLDPYFLGVVLDDGSLTGKAFAVSKPDPEIIAVCEQQAEMHGLSVRTQYQTPTNPTHFLTSKRKGVKGHPITTKLGELGELGLWLIAGHERFVPDMYKYGSKEQRAEVLAGLIDSGGRLSRGGWDWISKAPQLAEDMVYLARSLGLAAYATPCVMSSQNRYKGNFVRVSISGHCDRIPCRIPRRKAEPRQQKKDVLRTGFTAHPLGSVEPFFGFTLDGDGRYLLGDFTVTHNSGKTIISALAPVVLGSKRPLFLAPAKLLGEYDGVVCKRTGKTEKEFRKLAEHWQVSRDYTFLSYEKLSNIKYYSGILDRIQPDFVCCEEGHNLKNPKSIRSKVLKEYLKAHPETVVLNLTGTWSRNSMKDGAHMSEWCLGDMSPLPRTYMTLEEWSGALDENVKERLAPGALLEFCEGTPNPKLDDVRTAIGLRITQTPGFVTVQTSDCNATLTLQGEPFNGYDPNMDEVFADLRHSWETPDGVSFNEPIQLYNYLRQCQTGFHYYLDPPPPDTWKIRRRAWGTFVREVLKVNREGWLSEWQVAAACHQGKLDSMGLYAAWQEVKPSYDPEKHKHTSWFDYRAMEHVCDWLVKEKGIVFTPYVAVGEKLKEMAGVPYFGQKGLDPQAGLVDDYRGPCVASLGASKEGRNLQHYEKALIVGGVGSASVMEQLLGRLHRQGQTADEVTYDIFYGCIEGLAEIHQARREAGWGRRINADEAHKLLIADCLLPDEEEALKWKSPRWKRDA